MKARAYLAVPTSACGFRAWGLTFTAFIFLRPPWLPLIVWTSVLHFHRWMTLPAPESHSAWCHHICRFRQAIVYCWALLGRVVELRWRVVHDYGTDQNWITVCSAACHFDFPQNSSFLPPPGRPQVGLLIMIDNLILRCHLCISTRSPSEQTSSATCSKLCNSYEIESASVFALKLWLEVELKLEKLGRRQWMSLWV